MSDQPHIEYTETGVVSVENLDVINQMDLSYAGFGLEIGEDGRVWICVNGCSLVRFKPIAVSLKEAASIAIEGAMNDD